MPSNSENILSNQTHPGDSTSESVIGDKFKGDGYYGRSDGLHTVQYNFTGLSGDLFIQGTLALEPTESDWFTVDSYMATEETNSVINVFTGNYVWIRAVVGNWTDGTVNSIVLNH